jgi:hypothetical protein
VQSQAKTHAGRLAIVFVRQKTGTKKAKIKRFLSKVVQYINPEINGGATENMKVSELVKSDN